MKNLFTLALLTVCSFAFTSCDSVLKTEKKRVVVLLDLSSSIDEKVYDEYYDKINFVVSQLGTHDAISIFPIDGGSVTSFQPLLESDFYQDKEKFDVNGLNKAQTDMLKKDAFKKYCLQLVADIKSKVSSIDRSSYSNNTDILGALKNASIDIEDKNEKYSNQSILILSDMVQYADNGIKMTSSESKGTWIATIPKCTKLTKGIPIAVVTGSQSSMDTKLYSNIQNFWTEYFHSQGAKLICYNSAQNTSLDKLFKID
jgi:hypothetical protein